MTTEPKQNKSRDDLHPDFRKPFERWLADAEHAGFTVLVYETFRTEARQKWLYEAGRSRAPFGRYLTYTMDSCHRYGLAADIVPLIGGAADWSGYDKLYKAVPPEDYGLELLDFERPHIQMKGGQSYAKEHKIQRDVVVGSSQSVRQDPNRIPLYSALSNQQVDTITIIKREDGTYKAYTTKE